MSKIVLTMQKAPELIRSVLGFGFCDPGLQQDRLMICSECPSGLARPCWPGAKRHCCGGLMKAVAVGKGCGCVLNRLSGRRRNLCPEGHWAE